MLRHPHLPLHCVRVDCCIRRSLLQAVHNLTCGKYVPGSASQDLASVVNAGCVLFCSSAGRQWSRS